MIKKISVILLCGITSVFGMDSATRLEFMRNGRALSATMTQQQRIEFMRNGHQVSQQLSQHVPLKEVPQETSGVPAQTPVQVEPPIEHPENLVYQPTLEDDLNLTEDDIINHVMRLSLNDNQPTLNEATQTIDNANGKNVIINYNVTINQKLKYSTQNINIGKKNNNY